MKNDTKQNTFNTIMALGDSSIGVDNTAWLLY